MWYEGTKFLWDKESLWKRVHRVKNIGIDDLVRPTKKEVFVNRI